MYSFTEQKVTDLASSSLLYRDGYPHEFAEYYWLVSGSWKLFSKKELIESGFDPITNQNKCYAAPNSEEILIWKLKGRY
jgi:hypothetical protein